MSHPGHTLGMVRQAGTRIRHAQVDNNFATGGSNLQSGDYALSRHEFGLQKKTSLYFDLGKI